jgi:hypothetical protein
VRAERRSRRSGAAAASERGVAWRMLMSDVMDMAVVCWW